MQAQRYCPSCGSQVREGARHCPQCGASLKGLLAGRGPSEPSSSETAAATGMQLPPVAPPTAPAPPAKARVASTLPPVPPSPEPRTAAGGAHTGASATVALALLSLYPLAVLTATAIVVAENGTGAAAIRQWLVPVGLFSLGKGPAIAGSVIVALLALATFISGVAALRITRVLAVATGGAALGLIAAAVLVIGIDGSWSAVPTALGLFPFGDSAGAYPCTLLVIAIALGLVITGLAASVSSAESSTYVGPALAALTASLALVTAVGFAAGHAQLDDFRRANYFAATGGSSSASAAPGSSSGLTSSTVPRSTSTTRTTAPTTTLDPETTAHNELLTIAQADKASVEATLVNHWVPQLSSKYLGIVDRETGVHFDTYQSILQDYQRFKGQLSDVRLLRASEYSTFKQDGNDWWITVANVSFDSAADANAWCDSHGLVPNDCFAHLISHSAGVSGSAKPR